MPLFRRDATKAGDQHAKRGIEAANAGNYSAAVAELEQAIQDGAAHYDAGELYAILGKAYEELNQLDKAVAACRKALDLKPDYAPAWNNLGIAYLYQGKLQEAERCHYRALDLQPDYAVAYVSLGAVYTTANEPHKAVDVLLKAIALNPRIAVAHSNLALAYALAEDNQRANAALEQAITLGYPSWRKVADRIEALKIWREVRRCIETMNFDEALSDDDEERAA